MTRTDGESIVELQTEMKNVLDKVNSIENSMSSLHGKWDDFSQNILKNYVATETFEEYKRGQKEKEKNRVLEKIIWAIVSAVIVSLIAFFFRDLKI